MKILLKISAFFLILGTTLAVRGQKPEVGVTGKNGMVVTTQKDASRVGLEILQQGGNAIDAAVAVGYALAVTEPCCGNLGGGGFMLIRLANGQTTFINFRETAPLAASANMYQDRTGKVIPRLSQDGYLAVAVPGTVKGLDLALQQYGTLSRQQVMAGAISLAEKGFILQPGDIEMLQKSPGKLTNPSLAAIFLKNGSTPYQAGDRLVQKNLAQTLKQIVQNGPEAFYQGEIAQQVVSESQKQSGILSLKDFATYAVEQQQQQFSF